MYSILSFLTQYFNLFIFWKLYACVQNPDGVLKMRKLRKLVMKGLAESGITDDETQLSEKLEHKVRPPCQLLCVLALLK